jgi:hypothetical protein
MTLIMRLCAIIALIIFLVPWSYAQTPRWVLNFEDNFNGTNIDESFWRYQAPWDDHTDNNKPYWESNNVTVSSGNATLELKQESRVNQGVSFAHTSGMLFSRSKFKHGRFEIRCRPDAVFGLWPAFWLYGENGAEIDVFELIGEFDNKLSCNYHYEANGSNCEFDGCNPSTPNGNGRCMHMCCFNLTNGTYDQGMNLYGIEWGPNLLAWYLNPVYQNGVIVSAGEFRIGFHNYSEAMWVIANLGAQLQSNSGSCSFTGPIDNSLLPASIDIDYIRAWKRIDCEEDIVICNYSQNFDFDPSCITGKTITMEGNGCSGGLITGVGAGIPNDAGFDRLRLIATDEIVLKDGFFVQEGSDFHARIIDCPGGTFGKMEETATVSGALSIDAETTQERDFSKTEEGFHYAIAPNPNHGEFSIQLESSTETKILIQLLDASGKLLFERNFIVKSFMPIAFTGLGSGTYLLRILHQDNRVTSEKIIVL